MNFLRRFLTVVCGGLLLVGIVAVARADVLVFTNGDRVNGAFVRKEGAFVIFKSDRFGDLKVMASDVTVELTAPPAPLVSEHQLAAIHEEQPAETATVAAASEAQSAARAPAGADEPVPLPVMTRLAKGMVHWWQAWHGRFAVSLSVVNDTKDRSIFAVEARAKRAWAHDEVQVEPRYEYRKENDVPTMDILRVSGYWRHNFKYLLWGATDRLFTEYRPNFERDRIVSKAMQLQQQFGAGVNVWNKTERRLRIGVASNLFSTWALDGSESTSKSVASIFGEASFQLPWRVTITERGVWYFSHKVGVSGWENEFEFSKKITDTMSLGLRHEVRFNNPDSRISDFQRIRFLLGIDF